MRIAYRVQELRELRHDGRMLGRNVSGNTQSNLSEKMSIIHGREERLLANLGSIGVS